ncbi:MAG: NAD(P)/FAD-dependent oxidoreductase [Pseudomonadota bacterium]
MDQDTADVVVIGGGVNGTAAAYELARRKLRVIVVERFGLAAMASGWTLAGVRQSGRHPAELPLARAAVERWTTLDDELDARTGYRQHGNLRLARNAAEVAVIQDLVRTQQALGLDLHLLDDNAAVRAVAPALAPGIEAASFCPSDGSADPVATVDAFTRAAVRHGARFRTGERVTALEVRGGRIAAVVTDRGRLATQRCLLAAGVLANDLLAPLGLGLPLRRPMVTVLRSEPLPPLLGPVLGVANADMAGRQEASGRLRVTSGAEPWHGEMHTGSTPRVPPSMASTATVVAKLSAVLPAFADARLEACWAGLLDLTPDALPVLDHAPGVEGLVLAAGFSGHGFGIAPATAPILADLVTGARPAFDLAPFRFDRFAREAARGEAALTLHG